MPDALHTAFDFVTDTATLCVFDIAALKHRLHDDADWWSLPEEEVAEVNAGNVAFVGIGGDGRFTVHLRDARLTRPDAVRLLLSCPTGRIFIGAGEEATSGGFEPKLLRGGEFHNLLPGCYEVQIGRISSNELEVAFHRIHPPASNHCLAPVRL